MLPIPTYEEAIASRPLSSSSRLGAEEISDDAERQGLLRDDRARPSARSHNYEPPTVESARPSVDSVDALDQDSEDGLRQEMQQMEVEEPNTANGRHGFLLRYKRFTAFTSSFSSLQISSFRRYLPSISIPRLSLRDISENRVVILGRLFGAFLILGVLWVVVASDIISFRTHRNLMAQAYDPESVRIYIQDHMNMHGNIQGYLEHITQFPHIAGTEGNFVLAEWIAEEFKAGELEDVHLERFDVYLNYPTKGGRRLAITKPEDQAWEAHIEEQREDTLVFHGHSKSGDVTGPLVFANFGSKEDFQTLTESGISVQGAIVLVRYYGSQTDRAFKVKAAELAGAVGCIIYSDPAQDGFVQGPVFPGGRFMPNDGVQRGTVAMTSWVVGDVLSPGWPSLPDKGKRLNPSESAGLNKIPSLPISWDDAQHLLLALRGHGKSMTEIWKGVPNVEYWTGDVSSSPQVNLRNSQEEVTYQPIYNVIGHITGWEQPEKKIIVGNHHDAWCVGAADPGSGTAIMLEVIRVFGDLRRLGWRPLRTIEFASWDAEEYNLVGSTEHVENQVEELRRDGYAYLNVDIGVTGIDFHAGACPIFERPLIGVLNRVVDPFSNTTVADAWKKSGRTIEGLGAGSDHVAFQDIAGISSIDLSFEGQKYPYHSCYDNFEWMAQFGDRGFEYHRAMGQIWALLILELADAPLMPFAMEAYSGAVTRYVEDLESYVRERVQNRPSVDLSALKDAAHLFSEESKTFDSWSAEWTHFIYSTQGYESSAMTAKRISHNDRMANFEKDLLDLEEGGGLPNRTQFKHVIFAPQAWSGYQEAFFPGIRDAVDADEWELAQRQVEKISRILKKAAAKLND